MEKLQKAPFDEKISVVGLLLSGLNDGFREVVRTQERMQIQMKQMKELQMSGAFETFVVSGVRVFTKKVEAFRADWEKRLADGLLARTTLSDCRAVSAKLEADLQAFAVGTLQTVQKPGRRFASVSERTAMRMRISWIRAGRALSMRLISWRRHLEEVRRWCCLSRS